MPFTPQGITFSRCEACSDTDSIRCQAGVAVDAEGTIFVSEHSGNRVRKIFNIGAHYTPAGDMVFNEENGLGHLFSGAGRHQETFDLDTGASLLSFGYEGPLLSSVADRFGNATTIQRDGSGKPVSITSSDGLITSLTVDADNHLERVEYPDGTFYAMTYNAEGQMIEEVDPRGNLFIHGFDGNGKLTDIYDPEGGHWNYLQLVDLLGLAITRVQSAEGELTYIYDRTDETMTQTTTEVSPGGSTSTSTRSGNGMNVTDNKACGMTVESTYGLDPQNRFRYLKEQVESTSSGLARTTAISRLYQDTNADDDYDLVTETVTVNNKVSTVVNDILAGVRTATSPLGRVVTLKYDPTSLLQQEVSVPGLLPAIYAYDTRGRLVSVSTGSRTTSFSYDNNGYVNAMTNPDGRTVDSTYDVMGRLRGVDYHGGVSLSYDYDANGNLTVISNPYNVTHTFSYTANDQRSMMTAPLSGSYRYIFDRDRRLQDVVFPSGLAIGNVYSSGVLDYTVTPEGVIDYTWDCGSKVKSAVMGTEGISYAWDGSLLTSDTRTGLINQAITYGYDNDFSLSSMEYAGSSRSFSYDNDGLLVSAGSFVIGRNADNGLPESVSNGTFSQGRGFNGYGELDLSEYSVNGQGVYSWTVPLRDAAGRIARKVEAINSLNITWDYAYDDLGRLVEVRKDGVVVESYGYDLNGNRVTEVNMLRGVDRSSTYSDEDHVIMAGDDLYQFDVDGFLVSRNGPSGISGYAYSSRGELLEVVLPGGTLVTYEHDPLGRRIAKYIDGQIIEKYLWADMTTLLAVYDGNDILISRFEYADSRLPVSMTSGGGEYFLMYDQVGSLRVVTDTSGNIVKQVDYDSFGNVISDSNPSFAVPFGFAGGLYDTDTGLVRFGFRDYDPALGRWTAKDPIDFAGGDWNLYGYVQNNPINLIDPLGLEPPPYPFIPGQAYPAHNPFENITRSNVRLAEKIWNPWTFRYLVKTGGPWDFKQSGLEWEDFGNYNYGATGAATGLFSLETLLREPGRVQECPDPSWGTPQGGPPYGDDPRDQYWIMQGYNDYMKGMYGAPNSPSPFYGIPAQFWGNILSRKR